MTVTEIKQRHVLTAVEILSADDITYEEIDCPEWGGVVRLRTLSGDQAATFIDMTPEQRTEILPRLVALCAVDEAGARLFAEADVERLGRKSMAPLMRLQRTINRMNGFEGASEAKNDSGGLVPAASPSA